MKKNFLLITGGTGGHVIPAKNFANYLSIKNINCTIITDKRGYKYFDNYSGKIYVISSSNLNGNIILKIFGIFQILLGLIQSFIIIFLLKPSHSISFGSYASFSPMLSCMVFKPFYKVKLYIHEQNSIIGRTNKFFLNFTNKLFLNFDIKSKINSKFKDKCIPLDNMKISETLPIIKSCDISICNDTSFSHLSSALGIKTITLMADTPLIYGSYSSNMYPIIPDGETTVTHNTLGKNRINPDKIFNKLISLIN